MTDELAVAILEELRAIRRALETPGTQFVSAAELARLLDVSRDFVYARAEELGAVRLPSPGGKSRLRFDPQVAAEALRDPEPKRAPRKSSVELLPIGRSS